MSKWQIEKHVPTRSGVWVEFGGTYRWLWMARVAKWCLELCPDLRHYAMVEIRRTNRDGLGGEG